MIQEVDQVMKTQVYLLFVESLTLQGHGISMAMYKIYMGSTKFDNRILYTYVLEFVLCTFALCQGENKNLHIIDIKDKKTIVYLCPRAPMLRI